MRPHAFLFLVLMPAVACAQEFPLTVKEVAIVAAENDCKVYGPGVPTAKAVWTGPCKDGLAEGQGTLQWTYSGAKGERYQGEMKGGRYHGLGYTMNAGNTQYEGYFVDGQREGFGIEVTPFGGRYDGDWKAGRRHGQGKAVYALGGSYEGGWAANQFHGKGTIVYAGGRRAEYDFVNGSWPDKIARVADERRYNMRRNPGEAHIGGFLDKGTSNFPLPPQLRYDQLSEQEKRTVAAVYPLMDPADEPPYYAAGPKSLFKNLMQFSGMGDGVISVQVTVGPDGAAQSVKTLGSPSPTATKVVSHLFMLEKYKPGKCAGQPCTMVLPAAINFQRE